MAVLTSFLATRPVLVGSGRPLAGGPTESKQGSRGAGEEAAWGLSPRAPHLQALTSADTTGQRALVNTRDEPTPTRAAYVACTSPVPTPLWPSRQRACAAL